MKKLLILAGVLGTLVAVPVLGFLFWLPPRVAGDLSTMLTERTGYDVEIAELGWSFVPRLRLVGGGIRVGRHEGAEPIIELREFELDAELSGLLAQPRRVRSLLVNELTVRVPRGRGGSPETPAGEDLSEGSATTGAEPSDGPTSQQTASSEGLARATTPVVIDRLVAERARIEIARTDKPPRIFDIHVLELDSVALDRPISFQASLTNPKPVGQVATSGQFGPWHRDEVRDTPISGDYVFEDADLGEFKGIGGILASTGTFGGTLGEIHATGEAQIPEFQVTAGQVVPLDTSFEVAVGDRGGDVQLRSVHTRFLESELLAIGEVVRVEGARGRSVVVDVTSDGAHVEDLIRFGLQSETPPLSGPIELRTRLEIPPGDRPVIERMIVTGDFVIDEARFANLNVQKTLAKISQIGQGTTSGEDGASVVSDLRGVFEIRDTALEFSRLTFAVPGMEVRLVGGLGLRDQSLDFGGQLQLDQSISQLAPRERVPDGAARWLRLLDPLFQGDQASTGTVVPIRISGTREKPSFGVELGELKPDWRRLLQQFSER